jgi:glutamate decarboxylase
MLSAKVRLDELDDDRDVSPTYACRGLAEDIPRYEMPEGSMEPDVAYQLVHDELALDGNPILNMATFVTTWMDEQADRLPRP